MSVDRCPSCAATVPAGAPWCTLCWAPLRQPEPEPAPVTVPATVPASAGAEQPTAIDPLTAPLPAFEAAPEAAPATSATHAVGWPCVTCNISVPIDDDECPNCGRRFLEEPLSGDPGLVDKLPAITQRKGFTATVIVAGSVGMTIMLISLLAILGLVF